MVNDKAENGTDGMELKWIRNKRESMNYAASRIKEDPNLVRSVPSVSTLMQQVDQGTTLSEQAAARAKSNPLVPIGMLATVGALCVGIKAMITGNSSRSQMAMRWRVGAQAFTIVALVGGVQIYEYLEKRERAKAAN